MSGGKRGPKSAAAGAANLQRWRDAHPEGGALRHGFYSQQVRQRYSDLRTTEGRELKAIMRSMVDDLGGEPSAAQSVLLGSIRAKLVVVLQIWKYVDQQEGVITKDGGLLPVLRNGFGHYSEALRRDLLALTELGARRPSKVPDLATYLKMKREAKA
jgi:hypothetical protein